MDLNDMGEEKISRSQVTVSFGPQAWIMFVVLLVCFFIVMGFPTGNGDSIKDDDKQSIVGDGTMQRRLDNIGADIAALSAEIKTLQGDVNVTINANAVITERITHNEKVIAAELQKISQNQVALSQIMTEALGKEEIQAALKRIQVKTAEQQAKAKD